MKKSEVTIGMTVLTKVSGCLIPVKVVAEKTTYSGRTAFEVAREIDGKVLPKLRTAAAFTPVGK